jgi:hypothetical protein
MDLFFRYERKRDRNTGKYTDDILAADYLPPGEWKPLAKMLKQEEPTEYAACRTVANKLSAHLTYSRIHLVGATPPSSAVHDHLFGVAAMWLDSLEPDRRAWFDRYLKPNGAVIPLSTPRTDEGHNGGTNDPADLQGGRMMRGLSCCRIKCPGRDSNPHGITPKGF